MSAVAKRLDGPEYDLVRRKASAQATLCYVGTQPLCSGVVAYTAELLFQLVFRVTNDDVQLGRLKTQVRKTQVPGDGISKYGKRK